MARPQRLRPKRAPRVPDDHGGFADGGLAIVGPEGQPVHITSSRVAGALRYFLARVEMHGSQGLPERLALTSALRGEGVTYITRSLGAVLAYDTEATVLIVDMNWRRPSSAPDDGSAPTESEDGQAAKAKKAGKGGARLLPSGPGLVDVVERGTPLEQAITRTGNARLSLIEAGEVPVARRPALAASSALATVLDRLDEQFDFLLLDLPPVLATSEAMNLSQLADASVLVVRQGATTESQVAAALEEMQGVEVLGVILNRFSTRIPKRLRRLVGT